ncbi:hypothetical protein [uncultured Corynebacterium sp.]|uniref:hypothetical protein n=1 Tax=uncultured Corynebacterium sp. TaxID=159447 RepID=UPI00288A8919|nr:hypothetical protein [uncultured Corynebacterium sp.]
MSPRTGVERLPSNFHLAGQKYPLEEVAPKVAQRYPEGVSFDEEGFPDFEPYIVTADGKPVMVELNELSEMSALDVYRANKIFGICARSMGLAWHHVPNSRTLILIDRALQRAVVCSDGHSTNGPLTVAAYQEWKRQQASKSADEGEE